MKHILLMMLCLALSPLIGAHSDHGHGDESAAVPLVSEKGQVFGNSVPQSEPKALTALAKDFDQYQDKTVVIEAKAQKVCQKKGCWMVLEDGDLQVRTLFKDYGFFVPKDLAGKKVRAVGQLTRKQVSASTLRHYKKDEGAKMAEIEKIKTGEVQYQFIADGVEIL
jgi:hypothetical protein